jgi:hypothetical protein
VHAGFEVRSFDRDRDTVELVGIWRASFESGVGVTDLHPADEQAAFLLDHVMLSHRVLVAHDEASSVPGGHRGQRGPAPRAERPVGHGFEPTWQLEDVRM